MAAFITQLRYLAARNWLLDPADTTLDTLRQRCSQRVPRPHHCSSVTAGHRSSPCGLRSCIYRLRCAVEECGMQICEPRGAPPTPHITGTLPKSWQLQSSLLLLVMSRCADIMEPDARGVWPSRFWSSIHVLPPNCVNPFEFFTRTLQELCGLKSLAGKA